MLTKFSQGNNLLDPPDSNIDGFLTSDTLLLPFTEFSYFAQR
jgi:hypothetical protein